MTRLGGGGNAGAVESMENQTQVFHPFHRPLKIPQTRRDFHISTARGLRRLEKWKTQTRFPTFPPGARDDDDGFPSQLKDQRKEVDRSAAASFSDALSLRSSGAAFMLIFQLENAGRLICQAERKWQFETDPARHAFVPRPRRQD